MKIVLKHVIKNIIEKKLRSLIILLTILLSTLVLFIGLSLNEIINHTYRTILQGSYGSSNIVISKMSDDGNPFYQTTELVLDGTVSNQRVDLIQASGKTTFDQKKVSVSIIGVDTESAIQMKLLDLLTGEIADNRNAVIISERTASEYDLRVGDRIEVEHGTDSYEFSVQAISKPNGIFYSELGNVLLIALLIQKKSM